MCSACCRKFATENALWTHAAFKHPSTTQPSTVGFRLDLACRSCGCSFTNETELEHHLLENGPKQLRQLLAGTAKATTTTNSADDDCPSSTDSSGLICRTDSVVLSPANTGGKGCVKSRFACAECGRKFADRNALWTHLAFKHPDRVDLNLPPLQQVAGGPDVVVSSQTATVSLISSSSPSKECSISLHRIILPAEVFLPHPTDTARTSSQDGTSNNGHSLPLSLNTAQSTSPQPESRRKRCISHTSSPSSNSSTALMRSNSSGSLSNNSLSSSCEEESDLQQQQPDELNDSNSLSSCDEESEQLERLRSCRSEVNEESQLLMSTLFTNGLLSDHVASLEQRMAELQTYFSRLLADFRLSAAEEDQQPNNNSNRAVYVDDNRMVAISAEDVEAMEVGAEVDVVADESSTYSSLSTPLTSSSPTSGGNKSSGGRRRRRTKKPTRVQPLLVQECGGGGGIDVVINSSGSNSLEQASSESSVHRARLRA